MTARPVRFQFICDKAPEGLDFDHPVPESLITPLSKAREESSFHDRFQRAILPFMKEHEAACRTASNPLCGSCGSPITTVLQTPMSYLHEARDPRVAVVVSGVCGKVECEIKTRQAIQEEMVEVGAGHESEVAGTYCAETHEDFGTNASFQSSSEYFFGGWRLRCGLVPPSGPGEGAKVMEDSSTSAMVDGDGGLTDAFAPSPANDR
ncbi:hypothetical protein NM208_g17185 [Fusarium decemcellulare]|uniref:Uncharacterized protein n=1 Tax=Fusarium decemcellulare TaxID=57161 RepID=A0ACC1R832_9HYPO|nr:hypothetical protein NM208_g17185 [Fusarium decemcellulare]